MNRPQRRAAGLMAALLLAAAAGYAQTPDLAPLVRRVAPSVAYLVAEDANGQPFESGTAFAAGPGALYLTALHVVQTAAQISVRTPDGQTLGADVVAVDIHHDTAVLNVPSMPRPGPAPLPLGEADAVQVGQSVIVVGYPLVSPSNPTLTVTHGIVSGLHADTGFVQIDAPMNPGVSGGPVLTFDGRVIGVADAALRGAQQMNFAVAISFSRPLVAKAEAGGGLPPVLTLPLTAPAAVPLAYTSGGVGPRSHRDGVGVACVTPPPDAAELDQVEVTLTSGPSLHVVTWLSWAEGAALNSDLSFARIDATSNHNVAGATGRLHLEPNRVCLNYSVSNTSVFPIGQTFHVTYTLVYRVFRAGLALTAPRLRGTRLRDAQPSPLWRGTRLRDAQPSPLWRGTRLRDAQPSPLWRGTRLRDAQPSP
jgi:S1-C subfamily serine protease